MNKIVRWVFCLIAVAFSLSAWADIQADFSASTASIVGKDTILVRKVSVPGYGTYDVNFKWNAVSVSLAVDGVKASTAKATGLSIKGAAPVKEGSSVTLSAIATFDDGSTTTVAPTWSVDNSAAASISTTGILTAKSVTTDTVVNVTASYTDSGTTLTSTQSVTITNAPATITSIAVSGATSMEENSSITLTASAKMDDGSQVSVSPTWSVSNSSIASISSAGVLTAGSVTADFPLMVYATYTSNNVTVVGRLVVTIKNKLLPTRTCSGLMLNSSYSGTLKATFTIDPGSNSVNLLLDSTGANSTDFYYSSLHLVQNGNSIDFVPYASLVNESRVLLTGNNGWGGSGTIPSGTSKSAVLSSFPASVNLGTPLEFRYDSYPTAKISCP